MDLKKYKDKPTKNQRITALESVVKDLEQKIIDIRNDYRYDLKQVETRIKMLEFKLEEQTKLTPTTIQFVEEIIEFEGNQYRKVDREARDGDVVKFSENLRGTTMNKHYKVHTGVKYYDNDNDLLDVYGWGKEPVVTVYELIVQLKSVNQQRAEIIEKAKKFVEGQLAKGELKVPDSKSPNSPWYLSNFEFVVNTEKGTVVVLCKGYEGVVRERGIAKCNPSDVFNEHIGKAIALGRALGLDVSEFEQAVQPTLAIGQEVRNIWSQNVTRITKTFETSDTNSLGYIQSQGTDYKIINDTNAQYEEVK